MVGNMNLNCDCIVHLETCPFKYKSTMGLIFPKISDQSRKVYLGQPNLNFCNNKVDTTKYNLITFLPKSLLLQFFRLSNVVFLINAVLQSITIISSLSPFTAVGPLAFVLMISMLREGYEDYKRHTKDWQINSRTTQVLRNGEFKEIQWDQIMVGDYVKIRSGQIIPADILLLNSSQENSICYVETANLDGQNNLKQKIAFTEAIKSYPNEFETLKGFCLVDHPKANLYDFEGQVHLTNQQPAYVGYQNLILRETVLKNTDQIVGVALYCGYDTKILKNQGQVHHKVSRIEAKLNYIQIGLVILLVVLCSTCSIGYYVISQMYGLRLTTSYIPSVAMSLSLESGLIFFTVFLLLNFLIPITLNILIQGIKMFSGVFLSFDRKMYDQKTNKYCGVLNTSIVEELGVVDYILTDKTGTLTANEMVFKTVAIEDKIYERKDLKKNVQQLRQKISFQQFWMSMIICHDVVKDYQKDQYQGSSPDEVCFIVFANSIGYKFLKRTKNSIEVKIHSQKQVFELLDVISFTSRKRMSVIVRDVRNKQIVMYTKGADTCIFEKARRYSFSQSLIYNLNNFAKKGLRTLVFAKRIISEDKFNWFVRKKNELKYQIRHNIITKEEGATRENQLIEEMQMDLQVLGSTGIEDRLQQDVPQTISRLQRAGIKIMMVTGDKLQTAKNIGVLSQLIKQNRHQNYFVIELASNVSNVQLLAKEIAQQLDKPDYNFSLIIQGRQIAKILDQQRQQYINLYCKILQRAYSVIFCRSSPKEKALIVKFIKKNMHAVVLAIGDGGNDVGMIQQAHIGVGIIGKEGNSASVVSDFSFAKFKFLQRLVLHHGRWFYYRLTYFFVFFGWKNMIITLIIYFFQIDSAFSGSFNYTQVFYALFNSFFGVSLLVNFGLYDQDINDDLQPIIWNYLPQIYIETKNKGLFSYRRYIIWAAIGVFMAIAMYFLIRFGIPPLSAADQNGRIPDLMSTRLANGIVLIFVITIVNYIDTQTHTYFFQVFVLFIMTVLPTVAYFFCQNYLSFLGYFEVYSDNFNLRFWFIMFLVLSVTALVKIGIECYLIEFEPSIIEKYIKAKSENVEDLNQVMQQAISKSKQQQNPKLYKMQQQVELCDSRNGERDSDHHCNKKQKSFSESILKRFNTSMDVTTQGPPIKNINFQSAIVDVELDDFE